MKREFRQLRLSQLDRSLALVRSLMPRPSGGWIASVREALGLSQRQVGKKMHVSGQAIQQFEKAEADDRITSGVAEPHPRSVGWCFGFLVFERHRMNNEVHRVLRRFAGTMGCELVYVLVPKSGSFAALAEQPTGEQAARDVKNNSFLASAPWASSMNMKH
jgi:hypothetical protein